MRTHPLRWLGLAFTLALVGCSTTVTNLTPRTLPRNAAGLYPFEVQWSSNQRSTVKTSLQPSVLVGTESYPMQPTPLTKNRWETLVPVPADAQFVHYRFKFNYEYLGVPQRRPNSRLSRPYQLEVLDE